MLLNFEDYRKLAKVGPSLLEVVAQTEDDDIDFDPPLMSHQVFGAVDFD